MHKKGTGRWMKRGNLSKNPPVAPVDYPSTGTSRDFLSSIYPPPTCNLKSSLPQRMLLPMITCKSRNPKEQNIERITCYTRNTIIM